MPSPSPRKWPSVDEALLAVLVAILGCFLMASLHRMHLVTSLIDENSHLNFARLTWDSLTPGISQIGFWPPLLHFLLAPLVAIRPLYDSGLAGAPILLPSLFLAAVFLRRTALLLTGDRFLSGMAAVLLILNPFLLYYAVVPMMEVLFVMNVAGTAYALTLWLRRRTLAPLIWTGIFVTLACLSRYEGLVLIPVVSAVIGWRLLRERSSYAEMEAVLLLFLLVAVVGAAFIATYSWIYGGTPVAFAGGSWLRDPAPELRPARWDVIATLQYVLSASAHMLSIPFVLASLASAALLFFLHRRLSASVAALLVLGGPILFVLLTEFTGSTIINVPELPPYGFFNNVRYGLTWIGFAVLSPLLLLHALRTQQRRLLPRAAHALTATITGLLVAGAGFFLYDTVWAKGFDVIKRDINSPSLEQREVALFLRENAASGRILMARVDNDPVIAAAGIPLHRYVNEGNFRFFPQALREPWNFAAWVVMHNAAANADPWAAQNEPVFRAWGISPEFSAFYDLAFENAKRRVYRLNEDRLRVFLASHDVRLAAVPSLGTDDDPWDPERVYREMKIPENLTPSPSRRISKSAVRAQLAGFYALRLRPAYERGFFVDERGEGTSESQSYALWQAYASDDRETFRNVWQWTKSRLQRPDNLFHWRFAFHEPSTLLILDANSATDADTDIAYVLLQAGKAWEEPSYVEEALPIIRSIWENETAQTPSGRHVVAGTWAATPSRLVLNPSYFSPHAYRLFARYDAAHDWEGLIEQGYEDVALFSRRSSGALAGSLLPPNWIQMNRRTEALEPFEGKEDAADYSFDAFRTFYRIALDDILGEEERARLFLDRATHFESDWQEYGSPCTVYEERSSTGSSAAGRACHFSLGPLAGPLSVWTVTQPHFAEEMVRLHYAPKGTLEMPPDAAFYEKSWYWFGLWLWSNAPDQL